MNREQGGPATRVKATGLGAQLRVAALAALAVGLAGLASSASANPQGGQVVAGHGTITDPNSNTTLVSQQSNRLVVNWSSFNVAANQSVQFQQPSASSVALNRILDGSPSQILGSINANGQVFLLNGNGIVFGRDASVNVAGLFATSLDISNDDFMNGRLNFSAAHGQDGGAIINHGLLQASTGGSVTLLGGAVYNDGAIIANLGQVDLVAGHAVTVDFAGDGLMQFEITAPVLHNMLDGQTGAAVTNAGTVQANGGSVVMSADTAEQVFAAAVNNSGVVEAAGVSKRDGGIFLTGESADDAGMLPVGRTASNAGTATSVSNSGGSISLIGVGGDVENSGTLNASAGRGAGGSIVLQSTDVTELTGNAVVNTASSADIGGSVQILGNDVGLFDNASVDASGALGGGTILVGGDAHGAGSTQTATAAVVGPDVNLSADATQDGNGGKVVLWSNSYTDFEGSISAKGGATGGNGGWVETSSADNLQAFGNVSASAPSGKAGLWLLDPRDVTITTSTGGGAFGGGNPSVFTPTGNSATVNVATINGDLAGGTSVTITTGASGGQAGNIADNAVINPNITTGTPTLTLTAAGSITISSAISPTGNALNVALNAPGGINLGANITTNGGAINLNAPVNLVDSGSAVTYTLNAAGAVSGGGNIVVGGTLSGTNGNNDSLTLNAGTTGAVGTITLQGVTSTGCPTGCVSTLTVAGGNVQLTAATTLAAETQIDFSGADQIFMPNGTVTFKDPCGCGTNFLFASGTHVSTMVAPAAGQGTLVVTPSTGNFVSLGTIGTAAAPLASVSVTVAPQSGFNFYGNIYAETQSYATPAVAYSFNGNLTLDAWDGGIGTGNINFGNVQGIPQANGDTLTINEPGTTSGTVSLPYTSVNQFGAVAIYAGTLNLGSNTPSINSNSTVIIAANSISNLSVAGTAVTIEPASVGTAINIGSGASGGLALTDTALNSITASSLTIGNASDTGTFTQSGSWTPNSYSGGIALIGGAGAVNLNAALALGSDSLTVSGLNITEGGSGSITQTSGTASFTTSGTGVNGGIALVGAGTNSFAGAVSLNTAATDSAAVSLSNDTNALTLGTSSLGTGTLALTGTGISEGATTITQAAGAGAVSINAGAGIIALGNANSFTGTVALTNSGANAVTLSNGTNALSFGIVNIGSGGFTVNSGAISQSGVTTITTAGGTSSFTVGANAINLGNGNSFAGDVALSNSGGNAVTLNNGTNALAFNTVSIGSGGFTVTSGAISQTGATTITTAGGTSSFTAGANAIALGNANSFGGAVSLSNSGANAVTVSNGSGNGPLVLGMVNIGSGGFTVTADSISQSGVTTITTAGGTSSFTDAGLGINLGNSNKFAGDVALSAGGAVILNNGTNPLAFNNVTVGDITVTSGAITQTASTQFIANGVTSFNAGANPIDLNSTGNQFNGSLSFSNTGANDVTLVNSSTSGTNLNASTVGGNLFLTDTGGGNLTQLGSLTVTGNASFDTSATTGNIVLDSSPNAIAGTVSFHSNGFQVAFDSGANALTVGTSNIGKASLILTALNITISGLTQAAGAGSVYLATSGTGVNGGINSGVNDITGVLQLQTVATNTASVNFNNGTNPLTLDYVNIYGGLTTVSGSLSQSATVGHLITIGSGTATFSIDAAGSTVNLQPAGWTLGGAHQNDFGSGAVAFNGTGSITNLVYENGNASAAFPTLTLSPSGNLTVELDKVASVSGVSYSGSGNFSLAAPSISLGAAINTTGTVTLDANTLNFGGFTVTGAGVNLDVKTSSTAITIGGAGGLSLAIADLDNIHSSNGLTIGSAGDSGGITVAAAWNLLSSGHITGGTVALNAGTGVLNINAPITSNVALSFDPFTNNIGANVVTAGAPITFTGSTDITAAGILLDTTNGGGSPAGAAVTFSGATSTLDADAAANNRTLTITAGTGGAVTFGAAVGGINSLAGLSVTGASITGSSFVLNGAGVTVPGTLTFTADSQTFTSINTASTLVTLAPETASTAINIGSGAAAGLALTDTELKAITTTGGLTIGATTDTGVLTVVAGGLDLTTGGLTGGTLTLIGGDTVANGVTVSGVLTSPLALALNTSGVGGTIDLGNFVATTGKAITFTGPVDLSAGVLVDATHSGGSPTGANITLGTVDGGFGLSLFSGTGGVVTFGGAVGGTTALTGLGVIAGGGIHLSHNITTNAGSIILNGPVAITATITLDTTDGGTTPAGAGITLGATDDGNAAGTDGLTLTAGTSGAVNMNGAIGGTTPLASLSVTGDTIGPQAVTTTGNQSYDTSAGTASPATTLHGNLTTGDATTSGTVTITGAADLATAITIDTTDGGIRGVGANITLGTVDDANAPGTDTLMLTAGTGGAVTLNGVLGGGTALGAVSITGNTISLANLTLDGITTAGGAITLTGPTTISAQTTLDTTNAGGSSAGANIKLSTVDDAGAAGSAGLTLNAGSSGGVTLNGAIGGTTALGGVSIVAFGGITLNNITTSAGAISLFGSAIISAGTTLDTTNGAAGGAAIRADTIDDANTAGTDSLTLNGGTGGTVTLNGALGGGTALGAVSITGGSISLGNITTAGGAVTLTGPVVLASNVTIDTTNAGGSAAGAAVDFTSTVDADVVTNNRSLTLDMGTGGALTFGGAVGASQALQNLTINASGNNNAITIASLTLEATGAFSVTAGTGGVSVTSPTAALALGASTDGGALTVTAAGDITETGAQNITGAASFTVTGAAHNILLDTQANDFHGNSVTVNATGGGVITSFNLEDTDAAAVFPTLTATPTNLTLDYTAAAITLSTLTLGGTLTVTAAGDITETGAQNITGAASFTVTGAAHNIFLDTQANDFHGNSVTVNATGGGSITSFNLEDTDAAAVFPTLTATPTNLTLDYTATGIALPALTLGGTLTVTAAGDITETGAQNITGAASFTVTGAAHNIFLDTQANDFLGNSVTVNATGGGAITSFNLEDTDAAAVFPTLTATPTNLLLNYTAAAVTLPALTLGGTLTVTANGAITQTGVLTVTGNSSFTTSGNDQAITLNTFTNVLSGSVSFTTNTAGGNTGNVSLLNSGGTTLGASTVAGSLSVTDTTGAISESGVLTVATTSSFDTSGSGSNITLNTSTNVLGGAVSFNTGATSGNVSLTNSGGTNLGASTVAGTLSVTDTTGAISESGILSVAGGSGFTTSGNDQAITLNTFTNVLGGTVSFTTNTAGGNTGNVSLLNSGGTSLGASTVAGSLTVSDTTGAISQSGVLTVATTSSFTTAGANAITLGQNNLLTGAVSFTTVTGNASLVNNQATVLGASTVGGTFGVTTNGALTETGVLNITGAATFTQNSAVAGATQDVNLGTQANNFHSTVTFAAASAIHTLSLENSDTTPGALTFPASITGNLNIDYTGAGAGLSLGATTVGGNMTLTTNNGSIGQTGALAVTGTSSFTTAGGSVTLGAALNAFTGAMSFTTGTGSVLNLINHRATVLGASTVGGSFTLDSDGNITESGVLTVTGTSSFSTDNSGQTINLSSQTNVLGGAITLSTLAAASLTNSGGTNLALSVADGGLTVTDTTGSISESGVLHVTGGASFTTSAANQAITLNTSTNVIAGAISFNTSGATGNVSLTNSGGTSLGTSTVGGSLAVTDTTGAISETGVLTATGASFTTSTAGQAISLNTSTNVLGGTVTFSTTGAGANVALTNSGGTLLGTSTVGGSLTVTDTTGAISQSGVLTATGASFTTSGNDQAITLNTSTNVLGGTVTFLTHTAGGNTGNVTLKNSGGTSLGASTVAGSLTVSDTTGNISQNGVLTVATTSSFTTAGASTITLNSANLLTGAVSLTTGTGSASLTNNRATVLGASTVAGGLTVNSNGAITQTGVLIATGASFTTSGNDQGITLNSFTNVLSSTVTFLTHTAGGNTGNVSLLNSGGTSLGASTVAGSLTVSDTSGSIGQSGVLTVATTSSFTTAGNTITLNSANLLTGAVSLTTGTGNASLTNNQATVLGTSTVGGTLGVATNGALTETGVLTVTGGATFTQNSPSGNVNLGTQANDFKSTVTFGATTTIGNLSLENSDTTPGTLTFLQNIAGNLNINYTGAGAGVSLAALNVGGNATITTNNGAIAQSGVWTVTGTSSFTAGAAVINLNQINSLTGAVSLSNSGNNAVTLDAVGTLTIGTVSVGTSTLALLSSSITEAGTGTIVQAGGAGAVTLSATNAATGGVLINTAAGNNLTGAVTVGVPTTSNGGVTLNNAANALTISSITMGSGALSVTGNPINLNGNITTNGGAVTLNNAVSLGAASVTIDTTDAGTTASGANITLSGNLTGATDSLTLTAGTTGAGGAVSLQQIGNTPAANYLSALTVTGSSVTFGGAVYANAQTYNAAVSLSPATSLNLAAGNTLAFGSTVTLTGNVTLTADQVNFTGGANSVTGNNHNLTLTPASAGLAIVVGGQSNVGGSLTVTNTDLAAMHGVNTLLIGGAGTTGTLTLADPDDQAHVGTTINSANITLLQLNSGSGQLLLAGNGLAGGTSIINIGTTNLDFVTAALVKPAGGDTAIQLNVNGTVAFGSTLDDGNAAGTDSLSVNNTGLATFAGNVGTGAALSTFDVNGAASFAGNVTTTSNQGYAAVTLTGATQTFHTTSGQIQFASTLDGASNLTVNANTFAIFSGNVGTGTALASLSVTAPGIQLDGNVTTAGGTVTLTGSTTIGASVTIDTTHTVPAGATITLGAVGDANTQGTDSLTLQAGTAGAVTMNGAFGGGGAALANVTITAGGGIALANITTWNNAIVLNSPATLSASTALNADASGGTGGAITVNTINGTQLLDLHSSGTSGLITLNGALGGITPLGPIDINGGGGIVLNSITTAGGAVSIDNPATLLIGTTTIDTTAAGNTTGAGITIGSTVDSTAVAGSGALIVNSGTANDTTFTGAVGGTLPLGAVTVTDANNVTFSSTLDAASYTQSAGGGLTHFVGAVGTVDMGTVSFTGTNFTEDGGITTHTGGQLILANSGTATLNGAITAVGGVNQTGAGGVALNNNITTQGSFVTFTGAVTLGNPVTIDTTLISAAGSNITFNSTLDGGQALILKAGTGGSAIFNGVVGTTALTSIDVVGATTIGTTAITTTSTQTYNGAVTLTASPTLTTTNNAVDFVSTVDDSAAGTESLTVAAGTGAVTFGGAVGTTALSSLTVTGPTAINGGAITTTGNQIYNSAVVLGTTATLTTTANGAVHFFSTVDDSVAGTDGLLVAAGTGAVTFDAAVGGITPFAGIAVTGPTFINGGAVTTSNPAGGQTYNSAVTLGANTTLTTGGGVVVFNSTVDDSAAGTESLTVAAGTGAVTFTSNVGTTALLSLDVTGPTTLGGSVTTSGAQTYHSAVTLSGNDTLTTTNNAVDFVSTVNGAQTLVIAAGTGTVTLGGAVGNSTALTSLDLSGSTGPIDVNGGTVQTTGLQTYGGAISLGANTTFTSTGGGNLTFSSTIDGAQTLDLETTGAVSLSNVGTTATATALTGLTIGSTLVPSSTTFNGNVETKGGAIDVFGPVALGAAAITLDSTNLGNSAGGADITLNGNVTGAGDSLSLTAGGTGTGSNISLQQIGLPGAGNSLLALTVTGNTLTLNGNVYADTQIYNVNVTLNGVILQLAAGNTLAFNANVALTADTTLTADEVTFGGTVTGNNHNLTLEPVNPALALTVGGTTPGLGVVTSGDLLAMSGINTLTIGTTDTGGLTVLDTGASVSSTNIVNLNLTNGGNIVLAGDGAVGGTSAINLGTTNLKFLTAVVVTPAGGDTALSLSAGGTVFFGQTLDDGNAPGTDAFTVSGSSVTFSNNVGSTALGSLDVTGTTSINGTMVTSGSQTYNSAVDLTSGGGQGFTTTNSAIDFVSTLDSSGGSSATISAGTGTVTFGADVGTTHALASLDLTNSTGTINIGGNVTTTGLQTYGGAVILTLGAPETLKSTLGSNISFNSTLDDGNAAGTDGLTVNAGAGTVTFTGAVGTTALASLSVTGATIIENGGVQTTGLQSYTGATTLNGNLTSTTTGAITVTGAALITNATETVTTAAGAGDDIVFTSTIDDGNAAGTDALTLTSGGNVTISGAVGTTALASLTANGGTISLKAVNTTGPQSYTGTTTLNGNLTTTGAGGTVTVTGAAILGNTLTVTTAGNAVDFTSTLDATTSGTQGLTISAGAGTVTFGGAVGTTKLASLNLAGSTGTININGGAVTTTGLQTYGGPVVLGATDTLTSSGGANISFNSTVDAATAGTQGLTVSAGAGTVTFTGAVGTTALASLSVTGVTIIENGGVQTTGLQSYTGATTLNGNLTSTTTGAITVTGAALIKNATETVTTAAGAGDNIVFTSTINDGNAAGTDALTLTSGGNVSIGGAVGTTALASLTASGGTISLQAVTTKGPQSYTGATTLNGNLITTAAGGNVTVTGAATLGNAVVVDTSTGGGTVDFTSTVNGANSLVVHTGTGSVTFGGAIGPALTSLTVTNTGSISTQAVTTVGAQNYTSTGAITFNAGLSTTGAGGTVSASGLSVTTNGINTSPSNSAVSLAADNTLTLGGVTNAGTGTVTLTTVTDPQIDVNGVTAGALSLTSASFASITASKLIIGTGVVTGIILNGPTINTNNVAIQFAENATLGSATAVGTTNANITFSGTLDGGNTLALNAGGANVTFAGPVGSIQALTSLTVTGLTVLNGNVSTTGAQLYNNGVNLNVAAITLNAGSTVTFDGGVSSTAVGGGTTLIVNGAAIINAGNVSTGTLTQSYNGTVTLGAPTTTLTAGGLTGVTFGSTVNGADQLTVSGNAVFNGIVGGTANLTSLDVTGTANVNTTGITTTGAQTFTGAVTLSGANNPIFTGSTVTFGNIVTGGGNSLTVTGPAGSGNAVFDGAVSGVNVLGITGTTAINTANISTTGNQTYGLAVTLGAPSVTLTSAAAGGNITFNGNITGSGDSLTISDTGFTTTLRQVGVLGGSLSSLSIDPNAIILNGPVFANTQTYNGQVTLGAATTLTGNATFAAAIIGGNSLTVTGNAVFNAAIAAGDITNLNVGGATTLNAGVGPNVVTSGTQTYGGLVTLAGNTTLSGTAVAVNGGATGSGDTLTLTGANSLGGTFTVASLTTGAGGITLTGPTTIDTTSALSFGSAISGANSLTINTNGNGVTLPTITGIGALSVTGSAITAGNVSTNGGQAYTGALQTNGALSNAGSGNIAVTGAVTLGGATTLNNSGGGIQLGGTVDGATALTLTSSGATSVTGAIGGTTPLTSLTITSGGTTLGGAVTTTGSQSYSGATTLNGSLTTGKAQKITFSNGVNVAGTSMVTMTSDSINFNGGNNSVTGTGQLVLLPVTNGLAVDIGTGTAGDLILNGAALSGYRGSLFIGATPKAGGVLVNGINTPDIGAVNVNSGINVGNGMLLIGTNGAIHLNSGTLSGNTVILISDVSITGSGAAIQGANMYVVANGPVGAQGADLTVIAPAGGAGVLDVGVPTGQNTVLVTPAGGVTPETGNPPVGILADVFFTGISSTAQFTSAAQEQAANQQTGGGTETGFIDVSVFQQISLYDVNGSGIALPADQCEEPAANGTCTQ